MSANITPFNSDGGFTTAGNITGGTGNLSALNMSQSVTWPGGSSIYEDSGIVVQGTVGVLITSPGTNQITAGSNTWSFDNAGNLTTPGISGNITGANVISAVTVTANSFQSNLFVGGGNLHLQPGPANNSAYLDIYLTNGPDVHIAGNSENVIIGRDSGANVMVGANGNVTVRADSGTAQNWTFGNDGSLTVAGDILAQEGNDLAVQVFNPTVSGGVTYVVQNRQVDLDYARTTQFEVAPANIVITTDFSGNRYQWFFDNTGNVVLPDTVNPSINYANGNPYGGTGGSYGNSNVTTLLSAFGTNTISTSGNITASGLLIDTVTGITSNAGNININQITGLGGYLNAVGANFSGNINAVNLSLSGNIISDANISGNVNAANISAGNISLSGNIFAYGANIYSVNGLTMEGGNLTMSSITGMGGSISAEGNIIGANLSATGNVSGQNINGGNLSLSGNVLSNLNIQQGNISVSGNITSGSELTVVSANITGVQGLTVSGGDITIPSSMSGGSLSAYGNITGNYIKGDGSQLTNLPVQPGTYGNSNVATFLGAFGSNAISTTGNITSGYLFGNGSQLTGIAASYGNSNVATFLGAFGSNTVSTSGNVTAGYVVGNGSTLSAITGANVTGTVANATYATSAGSATTAATVTTAAQPNITSVGTLTSATVAGNINGGNLTLANGQINVTYTPSSITGVAITAQGANTQGGTGYYDFLKATNSSGGATNPNKSFRLNSTGAFEIINSAYSSTIFSLADNGNAVIAGNLTVQGTLTYVNTTDLNVSNSLITLANAATTPSQANGGGIQLNGANANIIYTSGNDAWNFNKPVAVTGAVTASTTVSATGNITGGNILTAGLVSATGNITGAYIIGNGSQLTGVTAYTNANVAAYLPTYTGNITAGNIAVTGSSTAGSYSTAGNVTGGNVLNNGLISSTGNSTAANYLTGGLISATGTIIGGNLLTSGNISATGSVNGSNLITAGSVIATAVSTTGNITTANYFIGNIVATTVSATGNITGGNISATNHTGTTVSVSGNVTAGNVINTGISSVTGNITAGNIATAGQISATGNITSSGLAVSGPVTVTGGGGVNIGDSTLTANSIIGGSATISPGSVTSTNTMSATGNITGGNLLATSNIIGVNLSASSNITGVNLLASGNVYDSRGQLFNVPASYAKYTRTTQQTGSLVANTVIVCNVSENTFGSDISVNTGTGQVTLQAGRTYRLRGSVPGWTTSGSNGSLQWCWYNETTPGWLGSSGENYPGSSGASYGAAGGSAEAVFTPGVTTVVSFRILFANNISALGGNGDFSTTASYPWIDVQVIGGQAALTGFSTTGNITGGNILTTGVISSAGNVTVGGNLAVTGNTTVTGGIRKSARVIATTTTLTVADASGFIEFAGSGTYTVTLPDPTQAANSGIGYRFWQNTASNITLSTPAGAFYGPSGSSTSTKVLAQATTQYWDVWSDGYNWAVFGIKTV